MTRVIKQKLYDSILRDYKTLLDTVTIKAARDTIEERIEKLKLAPEWRKDQNYSD